MLLRHPRLGPVTGGDRVRCDNESDTEHMSPLRGGAGSRRTLIWAGAIGVLVLALGVLAALVRSEPNSSTEITVMQWVQGWSAPGLSRFMQDISAWTDTEFRLALPAVAIAYLIFSGRARRGWAVGLAVVVIGAAALGFDYGLGQIVDRGRPIAEPTGSSFPSVHTFGSTVTFGFIAFLAVRHGLRLSLRGPLLALMATLTGLVGLSRVFLSAHWPTDVAAGYLLGAILLLLLIPLYGVCVRAICTEAGDNQTGLRTAAG